jgi:hypothetical protein
MKELSIRECTLTDDSKVYDVILRDLDQSEGEDCMCFNCDDKRHAEILESSLRLVLTNLGFIE